MHHVGTRCQSRVHVFNKLRSAIVRKFSDGVFHDLRLNYFHINCNIIIVRLSTIRFSTCLPPYIVTVNNEITGLPLTLPIYTVCDELFTLKSCRRHIEDEHASNLTVCAFIVLYYCCLSKYFFTLYWSRLIGSNNTFFF